MKPLSPKLALLGSALVSLLGISCEEGSNSPRPDAAATAVEGTKWREQKDSFDAHLSEVAKGWSKQQLLDYAGEPMEQQPGVWFYQWEEDHVHGGYNSAFFFHFDNDAVSEIKHSFGHVRRTPFSE